MDVYAAGAVAAFTVDVLIYPLDTLKTRLQSKDYLSTYTSKQNALAPRGLYQGIGSVVLATIPAAGLFFSTYEKSKAVLSAHFPSLHESLVHSSASAVAEMASCLILAPAEVIKQNAQMLQSDQKRRASAQALQQLGRSPRRLFTGYTALVARNLPFTALQFPLFERLRAWSWKGRGSEAGILETGVIAGGSAGAAGAVAAFVTTPSDVVKTRMMLMADGKGASAWEVAGLVHRERGMAGLFRGGLFRSAWTALGSSLYLGTYDAAKVWLRRNRTSLNGDEVRGL